LTYGLTLDYYSMMERGHQNTNQIIMPESASAKKPVQVTQDYVEKKLTGQ